MRKLSLTAMSLAALAALMSTAAPSVAQVSRPARSAPSSATFTPIGPLDSNVLSMSADGSILVGDNIFGGNAFRWTRSAGAQRLGAAGGQVSISRDGSTIVGDVWSGGRATAAIWQGGTTWKSLGGYAGSQGCPDLSNAYAVSNGGGAVVGLGWNDCDATAFRWDHAHGMVSLGSLDGQASRANDVNANGSVIVGWDDDPTGLRRGAIWVNGVESLLSTGVYLGSAEAVSADGSVVVGGEGGNGLVNNQAYRWSRSRGGQLLGKLPGGGGLAAAVALSTTSDGKVVVGFSGGARRDAFVWTNATGMVKLQGYLKRLGVTGMDGWRLDTAVAISADGTRIAGWGYRPDGHIQSWLVANLPPWPQG